MAKVLLVTKNVQTVEMCEATLDNMDYDYSLFVCPDDVWDGLLAHGEFDLIITEATSGCSFASKLLLLNRTLVSDLPVIVIVDSFKLGKQYLECGCDVSLVEQPIDPKVLQEKVNFALFYRELKQFCRECKD